MRCRRNLGQDFSAWHSCKAFTTTFSRPDPSSKRCFTIGKIVALHIVTHSQCKTGDKTYIDCYFEEDKNQGIVM
jgi:hypothetical protein